MGGWGHHWGGGGESLRQQKGVCRLLSLRLLGNSLYSMYYIPLMYVLYTV